MDKHFLVQACKSEKLRILWKITELPGNNFQLWFLQIELRLQKQAASFAGKQTQSLTQRGRPGEYRRLHSEDEGLWRWVHKNWPYRFIKHAMNILPCMLGIKEKMKNSNDDDMLHTANSTELALLIIKFFFSNFWQIQS